VKDRQGLDNVVGIDTQARILDLQANDDDLPAIMLYDYAAAFPSVSHEFLLRSSEPTTRTTKSTSILTGQSCGSTRCSRASYKDALRQVRSS